MEPITATLRLHLWFETDKGMLFGIGRALLLQKIAEHGSLNKAAEDLGMSYRAAWGKLKQTEAALGLTLCEKARGRTGYTLTPQGQALLDDFLAWHRSVEEHALSSARNLFPWANKAYPNE